MKKNTKGRLALLITTILAITGFALYGSKSNQLAATEEELTRAMNLFEGQREDNEFLEKTNSEKNGQIDRYRRKLWIAEARADNNRRAIEQKEEQIRKHKGEYEQLQKLFRHYKTQPTYASGAAEQTPKLDALVRTTQDTIADNALLGQENSRLKNKLETVETELKKLNADNKNLNELFRSYRAQPTYAALQEKINRLEEENKNLQGLHQNLVTARTYPTAREQELEEKLAKAQTQQQAATAEDAKQKQEIARLKRDLENKETKVLKETLKEKGMTELKSTDDTYTVLGKEFADGYNSLITKENPTVDEITKLAIAYKVIHEPNRARHCYDNSNKRGDQGGQAPGASCGFAGDDYTGNITLRPGVANSG